MQRRISTWGSTPTLTSRTSVSTASTDSTGTRQRFTNKAVKCIKAVVRGAKVLRTLWTYLVFTSLAYFNYTISYFGVIRLIPIILGGTKHPYVSFWASLSLGIASTSIVILVGVFVFPLLRRWDESLKNKAEQRKIWKWFRSLLKHLERYLASTFFPLLSVWLGSTVFEDPIIIHLLGSFVLLVLFTCMSMWTVEDFGLTDSINAVLLGLIIISRDDHRRLHLVLVAALPALKFLFIPFGNHLSGWAALTTDHRRDGTAEVVGTSSATHGGGGDQHHHVIQIYDDGWWRPTASMRDAFLKIRYPVIFGSPSGFIIAACFVIFFYGEKT